MPTKKKSGDRRSTFPNNGESDEQTQGHAATSQTNQYQHGPSPTAAFAIPPNAMAHAAAVYEYEEEDEEEVSYEVALISCVISLAIGFGTGYLV